MTEELRSTISSWKFQLETLIWTMPHELTDALSSQHSLRHLELGSSQYNEDGLHVLPDGVCPGLTSASGSICTLRNLGERRRIVAFKATKMSSADYKIFCQPNCSAVARLKYLSLERCLPFDNVPNTFKLNVEILEFRLWNRKVRSIAAHTSSTTHIHLCQELSTVQDSYFPELKILVLASEAIRAIFYRQRIEQGVHDAFRRLPKLRSVITHTTSEATAANFCYFRGERTAHEFGGGDDTHFGSHITREHFDIKNELGLIWWKMFTV